LEGSIIISTAPGHIEFFEPVFNTSNPLGASINIVGCGGDEQGSSILLRIGGGEQGILISLRIFSTSDAW